MYNVLQKVGVGGEVSMSGWGMEVIMSGCGM